MTGFLRKKAKIYIGFFLKKGYEKFKIKTQFIKIKINCNIFLNDLIIGCRCLSRFRRHLEIKKKSTEELTNILNKELSEVDLWEKYFESGFQEIQKFTIIDNKNYFTK